MLDSHSGIRSSSDGAGFYAACDFATRKIVMPLALFVKQVFDAVSSSMLQ